LDDPGYFPLLVPGDKPVSQWLQAAGAPLTFMTTVARPREIVLHPFFRLHDSSTAVYWDRLTPPEWDAHLRNVEQLRALAQQMEARTVDKVVGGDLGSETAHGFEAEGGSKNGRGMRGYAMHLTWRSGPSIAYRLKVLPSEPVAIRCRYFVLPYGQNFDFDIQVDGTSVAQGKVPASYTGAVLECPIPPGITRGKDNIQVVLRSTYGFQIAELRVLSRRPAAQLGLS
jgi:hypothetical protein